MRKLVVVLSVSMLAGFGAGGCGAGQGPATATGGRANHAGPGTSDTGDTGDAEDGTGPTGTPMMATGGSGGRGATAGAGAAAIDVCALITAADAARVLGTAKVHGKHWEPMANSMGWVDSTCEYDADDNQAGSVTVMVRNPTGKDKAPAIRVGFDRNKPAGQTVQGVGDAAYWWMADGLNVMKGDRMIVVNAHFDMDASVAAARIVAGKL